MPNSALVNDVSTSALRACYNAPQRERWASQKLNRALFAIVVSILLAGCAGNPPSREATDQRRHIGMVVLVAEVLTVNTSSEFQRGYMTSTFGLLGAATTEVLGTRRGHPVYRVKVNDELELAIASRDEFAVGDCVEVWYPLGAGSRHYFGLGEAGIAKASGCRTLK